MRRKFLWSLIAAAVVLAFVLHLDAPFQPLAPFGRFSSADAAPDPNYGDDSAWSALPGRPSDARFVPPGADTRDEEGTAGVDVFFIQPTTYFGRHIWNAHLDEGGISRRMLTGVLRNQAGAFNGCCRVFVPRYRQATIYSFFGKGKDEEAALDFAYQDVARAFDEFIAHRNQGRPFILAGHSQGSLHGMRLLQEKIAGTKLADRMVAAYLVGYAIPADMGLPGIGPCREPTETRCYISWNSLSPESDGLVWRESSTIWLDHRFQPIAGRKLTCVNPLTWRLDDAAGAEADLGSLPFSRGVGVPPIPHATGAACVQGVLRVTPPSSFSFGAMGGNYHIYDYNLFYLNLRANLAARVAAFSKPQ
ncbi:MAG TPA: DUF3089 domain-containing protein [Aliidongia sp.]|nr:DUF3089 domain-containing protein [Aliidongia sp.]